MAMSPLVHKQTNLLDTMYPPDTRHKLAEVPRSGWCKPVGYTNSRWCQPPQTIKIVGVS